ncbi:MAG: hypothetical protein ACI4F9_11870 [Lachnospiraceae bacterium]
MIISDVTEMSVLSMKAGILIYNETRFYNEFSSSSKKTLTETVAAMETLSELGMVKAE